MTNDWERGKIIQLVEILQIKKWSMRETSVSYLFLQLYDTSRYLAKRLDTSWHLLPTSKADNLSVSLKIYLLTNRANSMPCTTIQAYPWHTITYHHQLIQKHSRKDSFLSIYAKVGNSIERITLNFFTWINNKELTGSRQHIWIAERKFSK